jgi:PAS domain S-box-containing protein
VPEGDRPDELARSAHGAAAQLKLAAELANIVFWRHDLATDRLHYNDNGFNVLGIPCRAGGLTLEQARSCVHPDDVPKLAASAAQALLTDAPVDVDIRHRHGDGSWRCMLVRRVVERNAAGEVVAFVGVALDVTDRHAAAAALHAASERCALLTRSAGIRHLGNQPRA